MDFQTIALAAAALLVTPLLAYALKFTASFAKKADKFLEAKVSNELLEGFLRRLDDLLWAEVDAAMTELATKFKEAAADGKLTDEEKAELVALLKARLKSFIDPEHAKFVLGFSEDQLDKYLESKVKASVSLGKF